MSIENEIQKSNVILEMQLGVLRELADEMGKKGTVPLSQVLGQPGHDKPRHKTASEKVVEYIQNHPEKINLTVRELADEIGVGKSTVDRVLKNLR